MNSFVEGQCHQVCFLQYLQNKSFFWYYYAYSLSLWILNEEICRCKRKVANLPWLLENEYEKEIVSSFLLLQCLNIVILRNLVDIEKILFFRIVYHYRMYIFNITLNVIYFWGIAADKLNQFLRLKTFKDRYSHTKTCY